MDLTYTLPAAEFDARRSRALVAGGVGPAACAIGYVVDPSQFFRAWLIAYEGGKPKDVPVALQPAKSRVRAEDEAARLPRAQVYGPGR